MRKKWHIEVEVDEDLVDGGFNITKPMAMRWIANLIPFATTREFDVQVSDDHNDIESKVIGSIVELSELG
jgi:hypothetical protein